MPVSTAVEQPSSTRHIRLFRNGANQALRIPREFEFATQSATIRPFGSGLLIEPVTPSYSKGSIDALLAVLATMQPITDEDMPDVNDGLLALDDIAL
jgi:antitoxin VapB